MAQLREIAKRLNVNLDIEDNKIKEPELKRNRPWHHAESDRAYRPGLSTESIDQVNKSGLSNRSIDQVKNQVYKPKPINLVYKPHIITLENLRGNPLRVIRFLFSAIEDFNEKITRKIQLAEIMQALEITRDSARTGIKFLAKSNLISTIDYQAGLNGWTCYKLQESIFTELHKTWSIDQIEKPGLETRFNSSSSLLNITTTNINQIEPEIDITPLAHVGFTQGHILQVLRMNSPDSLQESINHFSFDLVNNEKWRNHKSPLNAFMAVLRRGEPWIAENYISPRERAIQRQLQVKKQEIEKAEKAAKELFDLEFKTWLSNLSNEEKYRIAPDMIPADAILKLQRHFKETVWQEIKKNWSNI